MVFETLNQFVTYTCIWLGNFSAIIVYKLSITQLAFFRKERKCKWYKRYYWYSSRCFDFVHFGCCNWNICTCVQVNINSFSDTKRYSISRCWVQFVSALCRGHLSPRSISIYFGWYEILRLASFDPYFLRANSKSPVINFIEIVNWGLFSTIPLGFWHIEVSKWHLSFYSIISINTIERFWCSASADGLLP